MIDSPPPPHTHTATSQRKWGNICWAQPGPMLFHLSLPDQFSCADPGFFVGGGGGGEGGPGPTAKKKNSLDKFFFFFLVLTLFYSFQRVSMFLWQRKQYFSKNPEGVQHFLRGSGPTSNLSRDANFYRNPYKCDFPGGRRTPQGGTLIFSYIRRLGSFFFFLGGGGVGGSEK